MDKQIEYSKEEQDTMRQCIETISQILISKKDEGFDNPFIQGSVNVKDENTKITFKISAECIENPIF